MKIKYITEGYFKSPQELKATREKSAAKDVAATALSNKATKIWNKHIIDKFIPTLNDIVKQSVFEYKTWSKVSGSAINAIRFDPQTKTGIMFFNLCIIEDTVVSNVYISSDKKLHFSINAGTISEVLHPGKQEDIFDVQFKLVHQQNFTPIQLASDSSSALTSLYSKERIAKNISKMLKLYLSSKDILLDSNIKDVFADMINPENVVIDDIFVNFESESKNVIINVINWFNPVISNDVVSKNEKSAAGFVDKLLKTATETYLNIMKNVFTFTDPNIKFRFEFALEKSYCEPVPNNDSVCPTEIKNSDCKEVIMSLIEDAVNSEYISKYHRKLIMNSFASSFVPCIRDCELHMTYVYDNKFNLADSYLTAKNFKFCIYSEVDDTHLFFKINLGLAYDGTIRCVYEIYKNDILKKGPSAILKGSNDSDTENIKNKLFSYYEKHCWTDNGKIARIIEQSFS